MSWIVARRVFANASTSHSLPSVAHLGKGDAAAVFVVKSAFATALTALCVYVLARSFSICLWNSSGPMAKESRSMSSSISISLPSTGKSVRGWSGCEGEGKAVGGQNSVQGWTVGEHLAVLAANGRWDRCDSDRDRCDSDRDGYNAAWFLLWASLWE